jgi:hypothetical protein
MALCDDCFQDIVHPLFHELMEKNDLFLKRYGRHAHWDWDDVASTLTFTDPERLALRIHVSVVGTTQEDSWEWSWANRNIDPHTKVDIIKVREFGETNGFEKLTSAFLTADEYTGWEMTAVAAHILDAPGAYSFPTEHGRCFLIYRTVAEPVD